MSRYEPGQAPRVTPEEVDAAVIKQEFTLLPDGRTTVCTLTLDNGFTVHGESSCVRIENFDEGIGRSVASKNAENEVWKFLGFRLAERLHREARGPRYRDAVTGAYVSEAYAADNPATTIRESA